MRKCILVLLCAIIVSSVYGVDQTQSTEIIIASIDDALWGQDLASGYPVLDRENELLVMNDLNSVKFNDSNVALNQQKETSQKAPSDTPRLGVVSIVLIVLVTVGLIALLR